MIGFMNYTIFRGVDINVDLKLLAQSDLIKPIKIMAIGPVSPPKIHLP